MMFANKKLRESWLKVRRARPGVLLAALLAAGSLGCEEENTTPVASPPLLETGADMVMTDIRLNLTNESIRTGELFADTAFLFRDSTAYHLRQLELIMFTETGAQEARVTAERGRFTPNTGAMTAWGNVVLVITEGNKRVESQELNYDPNGDRIWSDSATVMVEPGRVSEGLGFESDLSFRRTVVGPGSIRNTGGVSENEGGGARN